MKRTILLTMLCSLLLLVGCGEEVSQPTDDGFVEELVVEEIGFEEITVEPVTVEGINFK